MSSRTFTYFNTPYRVLDVVCNNCGDSIVARMPDYGLQPYQGMTAHDLRDMLYKEYQRGNIDMLRSLFSGLSYDDNLTKEAYPDVRLLAQTSRTSEANIKASFGDIIGEILGGFGETNVNVPPPPPAKPNNTIIWVSIGIIVITIAIVFMTGRKKQS